MYIKTILQLLSFCICDRSYNLYFIEISFDFCSGGVQYNFTSCNGRFSYTISFEWYILSPNHDSDSKSSSLLSLRLKLVSTSKHGVHITLNEIGIFFPSNWNQLTNFVMFLLCFLSAALLTLLMLRRFVWLICSCCAAASRLSQTSKISSDSFVSDEVVTKIHSHYCIELYYILLTS